MQGKIRMSDIIPTQEQINSISLDTKAKYYIEQSTSENSKKAFKDDMTHFTNWGGSVPTDARTLIHYLTDHAEILSVATLYRRLASINKAHRMMKHPSPTKAEAVKLTMRGIMREHGRAQRRMKPLTKDDLIAIFSHMGNTTKDKRDRALLIIGFCAALRKSELVAINCTDLEFVKEGLRITLPKSKTDQMGRGREIAIPYGRGRICAVKILQEWLETSGITEGKIFRSVDKGGTIHGDGLSDRSVSNIIKSHVKKLGYDPDKYSGHSLRAGLVTSAAEQGVSSWIIKRQTGHKSDAMLERYIRSGSLFTDNALNQLF
jgi:integrase